jgi:serine protease AprX
MSLGAPAVESYTVDPLCQATKTLHDLGIVVVASAGNLGRTADGRTAFGSITTPGISPWVITVGASNDHGAVSRVDDTVASFSSRGPTRAYNALTGQYDHLLKPDIVAPGHTVVSTMLPQAALYAAYADKRVKVDAMDISYFRMHGSSMSAAVVSGAVALVLEENPNLTPARSRRS